MIINLVLLYIAVGLSAFLVLSVMAKKDGDDLAHYKENTGLLLLLSLFAWPYMLFVWCFSHEFWHIQISFKALFKF